MDESSTFLDQNFRLPTKLKILRAAASLFAEKGYTETSVRELAMAVGIKTASIYNHFPSKNAILELMLDDYSMRSRMYLYDKDLLSKLWNDPTSNGILSCLRLKFDENEAEHDLRVLRVIFQEQHRNPVVRQYVSEQIIMIAETNVKKIIVTLKTLGIIRQDTDPDFWAKASSSLLYSFASRYMLGIGDNTEGFSGLDMNGMLKALFDKMLIENKA